MGAPGGLSLHEPSQPVPLRRWWTAVALTLAAGIFAQAVFAGAMLSGVEWAPRAHALNATLLTGAALAAGLAAAVMLRHQRQGLRFALTLLAVGAVLLLQTALGKMAMSGANLMWAHVPLGVALVAAAMQAVRRARALGEN